MPVADRQGEIPGYKQAIAAADGHKTAVFSGPDPGFHRAVIETRQDLHRKLHPPFKPFRNPENLVVGLMFALFPHGEKIEQPDGTGRAFEDRFENERVFQVPPAGLKRRPWRDPTVTSGLPAQEAGETTPGVHSRHAAPVDGTAARNQGRRMTVRDVAVIAEGRIGIRSHRLSPLPMTIK